MISERLGLRPIQRMMRAGHGYGAPQEQRYLPVDKPLHDHLTAEGTDGRAGEPRSQQGDFEDAQLLAGFIDVADANCAPPAMLVAKFPGSTYATAAINVDPRKGRIRRIPLRLPFRDSCAARAVSPGSTPSTPSVFSTWFFT
jgi:hypothetical protein